MCLGGLTWANIAILYESLSLFVQNKIYEAIDKTYQTANSAWIYLPVRRFLRNFATSTLQMQYVYTHIIEHK